ncbi:ABC transporter ATP-binding protein [Micromonospora sp. KC723]|uniref:ABC transporter ATP-binding protein n=1 Tax=Micromonospora sp. KC723 TaxID=2530381 RepID=UPI0010429DC4|nr:ABC transporter ATP-binding protein [Micromonospora sp. KC723]TDB75479.1 ABC transporter ATP-binding protein [Micromonospora sp. KC723]
MTWWNTALAELASRWSIVRILPRAGTGSVAGLAVINVLLGALPVVFVVATSAVLGRVPEAVGGGSGSPAWRSMLALFAVAAAAFVGQQIVAPFQVSLGELVARRIDGQMFDELMAAALRSRGIAPLEDQQALQDLRAAVDEVQYGFQSPGQACAGLLALGARYVQLVGYAVVIAVAFAWWAALALVVVVLLFRYGQRNGIRRYSRLRYALDGPERKIDYLRDLGIQPPAGKEIRIFGLAGWLASTLEQAYRAWLAPLWVARRRLYLWPFLWYALVGLALAGMVFAFTGMAAADQLTLTGFALVMQASLGALRLSEFYPEADNQIAVGMTAYEAVQRFAARVDAYPAEVRDGAPVHDGVVTETAVPDPVSTIHFDRVSFSYPRQDRLVFDSIDLTIPVGRCTAIVGLNGAGKTTLVKLLARLYEPTSGAIRVDGVDIRTYPVVGWRRKLGVIFQDFAKYEISAAANIGYGAIDAADDHEGIVMAARSAGIADELERLPRRLDTPLTKQVAGGTDLSGGQWQRVALARALFALRHGSPVVVLDEPTASLDVRAEARFFDEFAELTQGATTLLISHRFSTVRQADHIVVLEDGRVVEQGSHHELITLDGRYARLFRLQADRFTDVAQPEEVAR